MYTITISEIYVVLHDPTVFARPTDKWPQFRDSSRPLFCGLSSPRSDLLACRDVSPLPLFDYGIHAATAIVCLSLSLSLSVARAYMPIAAIFRCRFERSVCNANKPLQPVIIACFLTGSTRGCSVLLRFSVSTRFGRVEGSLCRHVF